MDPALGPQLPHTRINPRNASAASLPLFKHNPIPLPGYLEGRRILVDLIKVSVLKRQLIEVLSPEQLLCGVHYCVFARFVVVFENLRNLPVEQLGRQAAES